MNAQNKEILRNWIGLSEDVISDEELIEYSKNTLFYKRLEFLENFLKFKEELKKCLKYY